MNVETIIQKLETDGIVVSVVGDNIRLTASAHCPIEPHIISAVRRQKPAMIRYLRARADRSLEEEMKLTADPFWQAARPAGREIERLAHLGEAMAWLRQSQPKAHWQLTEFWIERLRELWESGKLREFQEALQVWVGLHAENCAVYQLVRPLQKR
jgi:hypothetical protein